MKKEHYKIHIIGAGISGLIAAIQLEKEGFSPTIIESTDRVGGRVKTDIVEGYQLDHGFQVLLDGYPQARKYLNYEALQLQKFKPGAVIFKNGNVQKIGDPLRDASLLVPTLRATVGSFKDKLTIFKLNRRLATTSLDNIFTQPEISTHKHLISLGFSEQIITNFFKPFFAGIFLEPDLQTSNRMFEFVYKMFGEGYATLPKNGIGAIAVQLKNQLKNTEILYNTAVKEVNNTSIVLEDETTLESHGAIIATEATKLVPNLRDQEILWKSCANLYFETDELTIKQPLIGLIADKEALVNNIFFHDTLETAQSGEKSLLSVTVVKEHGLSNKELIAKVQNELKELCGIEHTKFLKLFDIPRALPDLDNLRYDCHASETQLKEQIFLAGDHLLNGSLNAAMLSGERAAQGLINTLSGGIQADGLVSDSLL